MESIKFDNTISILTRPASTDNWDIGDWIVEDVVRNLVVTSGRVLIARMLNEDTGFDTGITFCAISSDTATPALADTNLTVEVARNPITRITRASNVTDFRTFFAAADATAVIRKTGLFGHSSASATTGTGELFNEASMNLDNSAGTRDITIVHQITIGSS